MAELWSLHVLHLIVQLVEFRGIGGWATPRVCLSGPVAEVRTTLRLRPRLSPLWVPHPLRFLQACPVWRGVGAVERRTVPRNSAACAKRV